MIPYHADDWLTVYHGDALAVLSELPAESVHCVVTSPPYWGLRDYGEPGQLGLEATPEAYVTALVGVFREVRRVLRSDGTVWLNLGDSYAANGISGLAIKGDTSTLVGTANVGHTAQRKTVPDGLKPKDLVGIPWMVAFALRADGWYLRSDIIWSKPNPMPESVTDRPTKSHEYLFLLSKSARYYFDADAVREDGSTNSHGGTPVVNGPKYDALRNGSGKLGVPSNRNIRSVWIVATAPYPGAHFATFPPKLIEPCIKAGTSERGVCPECGAPWTRVVERDVNGVQQVSPKDRTAHDARPTSGSFATSRLHSQYFTVSTETTGWCPTCRCCVLGATHPGLECHPFEPVPAVVLDPFAGSGTTGMVAQSLSRRAVLIDLSMDYLGQLMDRNRDIPLGLGA